jgi:hypothetical protein
MAEAQPNPEMAGAIMKFAVIEAVIMAIGGVFFFVFNTVWSIVAAAVAGSVLFMLIVMPVAMRNRPNDKQ